ncbi:FimV/HubP family polar landmark protein, partial [Vibrio coralliilyticus]|uniref:FimV/HubP family polar landmark protein n=1 Tax=Vibrio coralliilyticus TaxID=190893 RepID=UPI002FCEE3B6
ESEESLALDDLELPEYSEEDALADVAEEPELEAPAVESEESLRLDDLDLPEYSEEDALADVVEEPELEAPVVESEESLQLDDLDLPEYSEEDALADVAEEAELEASPSESKGSLELDDLDIPGYIEQGAPADAIEELDPKANTVHQEESLEVNERDLPEFDEQDALAEAFDSGSDDVDFKLDELELPSLEEIPSEAMDRSDEAEELAHHAFNEAAFNELLSESEPEQTASFDFDKPVDSVTSDSAGMDIEAMLEVGGEDWNGFSLSPEQQAQITDDIPEDQQGVWDDGNRPEQAQILDENWEDQEELGDFNPQEGEFRTIDELMAEVEKEEQQSFEEEELKLDVGLSDFPDVIGDTGDVDVDNNSEASGKLDLAKIYIEMNDAQGAIKLLEEAIVDGSDEIRREAKNLIDAINGR